MPKSDEYEMWFRFCQFEPVTTIRNMMLISNVFNGWQSSLMIWAKKENDDPSLLCGQGAAMWVRPQLIGYHHNSQKSTVGDPFQDNVHCKVIHSALLATLQVILVQQNEQLSMHQYQIVQTALCRALLPQVLQEHDLLQYLSYAARLKGSTSFSQTALYILL